jgi:hypothetical protein
MEILNNFPIRNHQGFEFNISNGHAQEGSPKLSMAPSDKGVGGAEANSSGNVFGPPDLKDVAAEMIKEPRLLGEFKNKEGFEEITDLQVGPDVQYALRTKNIGLIRRLQRGLVTPAEYRELTYKLRELEMDSAINENTGRGMSSDDSNSLELEPMSGTSMLEASAGKRPRIDLRV